MSKKLSWDYDQNSGENHTIVERNYQTYRIRAVLDSHPSNPFTDGDMNWPIVVRSPDNVHDITCYDSGVEHSSAGGFKLDCSMFTDAALVHSQHHILKVLDAPAPEGEPLTVTMRNAMEAYLTNEPVGYCHDAQVLRELFDSMLSDRTTPSLLVAYEELCKIALIPAYRTTVTGYSQGDWAEVLVVATPEAVAKFGTNIEHYHTEAKALPEIKQIMPDKLDAWIEEKAVELMLAPTAQLYKSWAFGDVYGYVVEKAVPLPAENDEDHHCVECGRDNTGHEGEPCLYEGGNGDDCPMYDGGANIAWEELPDGACWGFYGTDFDESGLEESALDCIPDEELEDA